MVNVEADVLAGPLLAREAEAAGVVYSLAYGDQPALICEMVDWARSCGFPVIAAGKGTKYMPEYHASTPDTVWGYYGLTPEQAKLGGMNPQMFNSFLDGTKSGIEMAAVPNASGLTPAPDGLVFPPVGTHEMAEMLRPGNAGTLHHAGQVEVISSRASRRQPGGERPALGRVRGVRGAERLRRSAAFRNMAWSPISPGRVSALYRPFHLIGLELNVSILSAALRKEATGAPTGFRGDVVSTAKRDLRAGEMLDGEGGACVWGKLMTAADSLRLGGLPIGLANRVPLMRDVAAGQPVTWARCADRYDGRGVQVPPGDGGSVSGVKRKRWRLIHRAVAGVCGPGRRLRRVATVHLPDDFCVPSPAESAGSIRWPFPLMILY